MKGLLLLLAVALITSGCHRPTLLCRTEYLTLEYLASEQVNTYDLARDCFYGQQIVVFWNVPAEYEPRSVNLKLHVRYGTRQLESFSIPVKKRSGFWVHRLINQNYWDYGGIVAYQAQLFQNELLIDEWNHHLWPASFIEIGDPCN